MKMETNGTGLVTVNSKYGAAETITRLQSAIEASGNKVFAVFDHAAGARDAGLALRATTVMAFGNPKAGTRLMQDNQMIGLELPLKILVWEDEAGIAKVSYNDPHWLAQRHALGAGTEPVITAMTAALASLAAKASNG